VLLIKILNVEVSLPDGEISMSFLDKAKKKAEEETRKAEEEAKKVGRKAEEEAKKIKDKGTEEVKKASDKVKKKL
jgi:vacuolar-type H+-ATPase subunit H